ncbi:MAG: tetratricopeptide repeat protein [Planctomycetes bacterium]|nr:tetratricopeptide repeat protein [Planctomycetota bacterium]
MTRAGEYTLLHRHAVHAAPDAELGIGRRSRLAVLAIVLAVAAVYGFVAGHDFVNWDDDWLVQDNPEITSLSAGQLAVMFNPWCEPARRDALGGEYLPIRDLTVALDYRFAGLAPWRFHLTNLYFHAAAAVMVFLIARYLLGSRLYGLIAGLLFAVHPAHVESVTWVSGRKDVAMGFFFLLSFYLYVIGRHALKGGRKRVALLVSVAAYACALGSKSFAVVMPVMIVAFDLIFARTREPLRKTLRRCYYWAPYVALSAAFQAIVIDIGSRGLIRDWYGGSWWTTFLSAMNAGARYLVLMFWPYPPLALEPCADFPLTTALNGPTVISLALVLLAAGLAVALFVARFFRRPAHYGAWDLYVFAAIWFFAALMPVSNFLVPMGTLYADRYLYLASVGWCLAAAYFVERSITLSCRTVRRRRILDETTRLMRSRPALAAGAVATVGLLAFSLSQAPGGGGPLTRLAAWGAAGGAWSLLWQVTAAWAVVAAGARLAAQYRLRDAENDDAPCSTPGEWAHLFRLGVGAHLVGLAALTVLANLAWKDSGTFWGAVLEQARRNGRAHHTASFNLGHHYVALARGAGDAATRGEYHRKALQHFHEATTSRHDSLRTITSRAHAAEGFVLLELSRQPEAEASLHAALDAFDAEARERLPDFPGWAALNLFDDTTDASAGRRAQRDRALAGLLPFEARSLGAVLLYRGLLAITRGDNDDAYQAAFREFRAAVRADPNNYAALVAYGNALSHRRDYNTAVRVLYDAIERRPDFPAAYVKLAEVLLQQERLTQAENCLRKALRARENPADVADAWRLLAAIEQREVDAARQALDELRSPRLKDLRLEREALRRQGKDNTEEARRLDDAQEEARRLLRRRPPPAVEGETQAAAALRAHEDRLAERLEQSLARNPLQADLWERLAAIPLGRLTRLSDEEPLALATKVYFRAIDAFEAARRDAADRALTDLARVLVDRVREMRRLSAQPYMLMAKNWELHLLDLFPDPAAKDGPPEPAADQPADDVVGGAAGQRHRETLEQVVGRHADDPRVLDHLAHIDAHVRSACERDPTVSEARQFAALVAALIAETHLRLAKPPDTAAPAGDAPPPARPGAPTDDPMATAARHVRLATQAAEQAMRLNGDEPHARYAAAALKRLEAQVALAGGDVAAYARLILAALDLYAAPKFCGDIFSEVAGQVRQYDRDKAEDHPPMAVLYDLMLNIDRRAPFKNANSQLVDATQFLLDAYKASKVRMDHIPEVAEQRVDVLTRYGRGPEDIRLAVEGAAKEHLDHGRRLTEQASRAPEAERPDIERRALAAFRRAITLCERLAAENPGDAQAQRVFALASVVALLAHNVPAAHAEATAWLRQAAEWREKLAEKGPEDLLHLAQVYGKLVFHANAARSRLDRAAHERFLDDLTRYERARDLARTAYRREVEGWFAENAALEASDPAKYAENWSGLKKNNIDVFETFIELPPWILGENRLWRRLLLAREARARGEARAALTELDEGLRAFAAFRAETYAAGRDELGRVAEFVRGVGAADRSSATLLARLDAALTSYLPGAEQRGVTEAGCDLIGDALADLPPDNQSPLAGRARWMVARARRALLAAGAMNTPREVDLEYARALWQSGDEAAAADRLERVRESAGRDAVFDLGWLAVTLGRWRLAYESLSSFLNDAPPGEEPDARAADARRLIARIGARFQTLQAEADAAARKAVLAGREEDWRLAAEKAGAALELNPGDAASLIVLARAESHQGRFKAALEALAKVPETAALETRAEALFESAWAAWRLSEQKRESGAPDALSYRRQAEQDFRRFLNLHPDHPLVESARAILETLASPDVPARTEP